MSKALLICNGEKPGRWLRKLAKEADFILAADAGADKALAVGVQPDAVIGDLDSVSPRNKRMLKETPFIYVKRQDNTDLEKALDWLVAQRFDECIIVGATGGRLDFTLGNILSARPYLPKIAIRFFGANWQLYFVTKNFEFPTRKAVRCSLIPLTPCKAVTLKGFKYPLTQENIGTHYIGRSLSNKTTALSCRVTMQSGCMLLYVEN